FDQIGIFGKYIEDISLLFDLMNHPDSNDSTRQQIKLPDTRARISENPQKKFNFCYFPSCLSHPGLDPEIKTNIENLIAALALDGHQTASEEFDLLSYLVPAYYVLTTAEASSNLSRYDGIRFGHNSIKKPESLQELYKNNRSEGFGDEVKKR